MPRKTGAKPESSHRKAGYATAARNGAPDAQALIDAYLDARKPRSLLTLGHGAAPHCAAYLVDHPDCRHTDFPMPASADQGGLLERLSRAPRADIAVLAGALEYLSRDTGDAVIATLRDVHGARLFILLPEKSAPHHLSHRAPTDLLGLGLRIEARTFEPGGTALLLYGFDIADYKRTPEWLGARHWANPEQWDKQRW